MATDGPPDRPAVDQYDTFLFDCDGVLWAGLAPLPGSFQVLERLRRAGKRLLFVTNNATASRAQYAAKFARLGFPGVGEEQVITSGSTAAQYLVQHHPEVKKVYVMGAAGLVEELQACGLECLGGPADNGKTLTEAEVSQIQPDPSVHAVVVGHDFHFSFYKLVRASLFLQQGALFIATNGDRADRVGPWLMPVNGAQVAALVAGAPGACPPLFCGKPTTVMAQHVLQQYHLNPERCLFVGDRLETDIAFGHRCGMATLLVLTGVATATDVAAVRAQVTEGAPSAWDGDEPPARALLPTFVLPDLASLYQP